MKRRNGDDGNRGEPDRDETPETDFFESPTTSPKLPEVEKQTYATNETYFQPLGPRPPDVSAGQRRKKSDASLHQPTPSQLENQEGRERPWISTWMSRFASSLTKLKPAGDAGQDPATREPGALPNTMDPGADSDPSDVDDEDTIGNRPRQQLLVVPQLWIWKVESTYTSRILS